MHQTTGQTISQPKLCASANWNSDGITFANGSSIGDYLTTIFISTNDSIFVVATNSNAVQIWMQGDTMPTKTISNDLNKPYGLFLSANGDIIIDNGYMKNRVEKWTLMSTTGTTVMNVSASCYGLFIDRNNILYCSLSNLHQIVEISLNSSNVSPTTIAGNGSAGLAANLLNSPHGIYVNKQFQLYVADTGNNRIQLFNSGQLNGVTVAGSGTPAALTLNHPKAVILDSDGNLFIVDTDNNRIIRSDATGYRCIVGCTGVSGSQSNELSQPWSMSFDSYGNLFVVDQGNNRIQKFLLATNSCGPAYNQPKFCPTATWNSNATTFTDSSVVGLNASSVFVDINNTVYVAATNLNQVKIWSTGSSSPTTTISVDLNSPSDAVRSFFGDIFIDNTLINYRIDRWSLNNSSATVEMYVNGSCFSLFIDINDYLYCSMESQHQVLRKILYYDANISAIIAGTGIHGSASNMLNGPRGIFVDDKSNLYVADCYNDRVQRFASGQSVAVTIAGDGVNNTISLSCPTGVILDSDGYLFISDYNNHRIIGSGPDGYRCIVACSEISGSSSDQLTNPTSISFDCSGNLYVVDMGNSRIQQFSLATNSCGSWFNQPVFCASATWDTEATTFANSTDIGFQPYSIFVSNNNTVYVGGDFNQKVQIWSEGNSTPTTITFPDLDISFALFVTKLGDIYVDNGYVKGRADKWSAETMSESVAMYVNDTCNGLFVDIYGNIYCSQGNLNQVVQKLFIDDANTTSVIAGTSVAGSAADTLNGPQGIFVTSTFNLYVADCYNNRIQLFLKGKTVATTVAGNGALGTISLQSPRSVTVDSHGYIFITDSDASRIVGSSANGFRCIAGCSGVAGSAADQLYYPRSFSFDNAGNLLVADRNNSRIQKFALTTNACGSSYNSPKFCTYPTWNLNATTFANNSTVGTEPRDIYINLQNTIYIAATNLNQVQLWTVGNSYPTNTISIGLKSPNAIFASMTNAIYVDNTIVNGQIDKWAAVNATNYTVALYSPGICYDIFLDTYDNIFCSLTDYHMVITKSFNNDANTWSIAAGNGTNSSDSDSLNQPRGIFIDIGFNLYVADCGNNRIQMFQAHLLNGTTIVPETTGTITLNCPTAVIIDKAKNLYIVDSGNHRIIATGYTGIQCIIGCNGSGSEMNQLFNPRSISFDSYGNLYVVDTGNSRIQMFQLASNSCHLTTTTIQTTMLSTMDIETSILSTIDQTQTTTTTTVSNVKASDSFVAPTCSPPTSTGPNCDETINACDLLNPCQNDGTCIVDNSTLFGYYCLCLADTDGSECQYDYRVCQSDTCWNTGTCLETSNTTFQCTCAAGWQNTNCELLINYCKNVTCENNGVCIPLLLDYKCECISDSYSGRYCETVSSRITTLQIVSKSFAFVAILAMTAVVAFVVIMDILTYFFGIDLAQAEREALRRRHNLKEQKLSVFQRHKLPRISSSRLYGSEINIIVEKTL